jgi:rSAM/selenodomain-associated transferase 1
MIDCELVVVAKHPELGKVKTRLARGIGERGAFDLYRAFLADIVARFDVGPHAFAIAFTPEDAAFEDYGTRLFAQRGPTLNDRLHAIFVEQRARARKTLVMSSDSPQVDPAWILRGFAALDEVDVVLGPCEDGGYWCVAMREPHEIFRGVAMSTPAVLDQTLALVSSLGLRHALLPTTFDVDEFPDLDRLRDDLARGDVHLPATSAALRAIANATTAPSDTLVIARKGSPS